MFEDELFIYIKSLAKMPSLLKLLILIAVFKPDIYKTAWSWVKYLWFNKKAEKLRALLKFTFTKGSYSVDDIDASIRFTSLIEGERLRYNAMQSNFCTYHNGLQNGYRNYSCRVESIRDFEFSWMHTMQSQPLSPFEKIIQRFENESVQIIDVDDETTDFNQTVLMNLRKLKAKRLILVPVVVPVVEALPGFKYSLKRTIDGVDCFVMGVISTTLDDESLFIPKHDIALQGKNLIQQVTNMFLANPKAVIR